MPEDAPSRVADEEQVIRVVPHSTWLSRDGRGRTVLTTAAFPEDELAARKGKSVSVFRSMMDIVEVKERAGKLNKEAAWEGDPVVARSRVEDLRTVRDAAERREVCVNADPWKDEHDSCPTHASILRACPPLDTKQRLQWTKLRVAVAEQFKDVTHCSGKTVTSPSA